MLFTYGTYNVILVVACLFAYFAEHGNAKLSCLFSRPFESLSVKSPSVLRLGNERHFRLFCRFVVFLALWIPASLRYGVGIDYFGYVSVFNDVTSYERADVAWVLLNRGIRFLGLSSQWVFVVSSLLCYFPICFMIKRKNFFFSIAFYFILEFYFESLSAIRQQIAVSFCIAAVTALEFKKNIRFFIWVFFASLFHQSALFILPFFPLKYIKFKRNIIPVIIVAVGAFLIFKFNVFEIILSIVKSLQSKYAVYDQALFLTLKPNSFNSGLGLFAKILPSLFILFMLPRITKKYPQKAFVVNLIIVYILLYCLSRQYSIMKRARNIYGFVPILMSGFAIQAAGKYKRIAAIVIISASLLVFEKDNIDRPYYTIFTNVTDEEIRKSMRPDR